MSFTETLQTIVNLASTHVELMPLAGVGGYSNEPALSLCKSVFQELLASPLDWKFNRAEMNYLCTSPYRQDYLFAGATIFSLGGNAQGAGLDLASNNALTISGLTVTIKTLDQYNGAVGDVCYIRGTGSNYDSTFTQNGVTSQFGGNTYAITNISGLTITATLTGIASGTSGSAGITDFGWLAGGTMVSPMTTSAILPTRHVEATRDIQPYGYSAAFPEKVCVVKDNNDGTLKIRFYPVPGNSPWLVSLVYQKKAPIFTALSNTWAPFPDELSYVYRQGFLAAAYRYINSPRADAEAQKFQVLINKALGAEDREEVDIRLYPEAGFLTSQDNWWVI